jgi:hypothetical protein
LTASARFRVATGPVPARPTSARECLRGREEDRRDAERRHAREGVRTQRRARKLFK